jgi:Cu/Ag efflux pump CusA
MVAKYVIYRDNLKNGYIDISKEEDKYKLFSELSIYVPLFVLLIFTVIVFFSQLFFKKDELLAILSGLSLLIIQGVINLLISYKEFIDNKLFVGLNKANQ